MTASFENIVAAVCWEFGITQDQLMAPNRSQAPIAYARATAIWLAWRAGLGKSWSAVGRLFGRDRTTVRDAVLKVSSDVDKGTAPDSVARLMTRFNVQPQ